MLNCAARGWSIGDGKQRRGGRRYPRRVAGWGAPRLAAVVLLGLVTALLREPLAAEAVVIEQLPLAAASSPASYVFSWPGGAALSGTGPAGGTPDSYEAIGLQPFKVTPGPAGNEVITAAVAPNGAPWIFTFLLSPAPDPYSVPQLDELTAGGPVLRYSGAPRPVAELPTSMAFGADGAIWTTRPTGIERDAPGSPSEFYPVSGYPYQIVAGPDGDLWFTQLLGNEIGRMNLAGEVIAEYGLPGAHSIYESDAIPYALAVGPEDDVYFTEQGLGRIGRLAASGELREFGIRPPAELPAGIAARPEPRFIAAGGEGSMWFTDPGTEAVGQLTPSGEVSEYRVPPVSTGAGHKLAAAATPASSSLVPAAIAAVPGGLFFSELDAKAIGLIEPNAQPAAKASGPRALRGRASASRRGCRADAALHPRRRARAKCAAPHRLARMRR
jgi:streptogramin lyase